MQGRKQMRHLLIFLVKLARDANFTDRQIADELEGASKQVRKGEFWPTDISPNSIAYR
jgi:hypothetical protein